MASKTPKTERRERGVYLREDGNLRFEVKIRYKDCNGDTGTLGTTVFPFDPKAKPSGPMSQRNALSG